MIRVFENLQEYNTFTNNGQNLVSGDLYWVKGEKSAFFLTNNIDGEVKKYDMMDEIPEGYIQPTGNIAINANGEEIDISQYATASVNVPIPEGYIVPSGNKEITQNGTNIDVAQYATASVNVAPNLTTQNITENGIYQPSGDYDGFSSVTVNVAGSGGNEDLIDIIEKDFTTFNIPNGTTKIGDYSFYYKRDLTNITIPDSVTSIGNSAFCNCEGLTNIVIPNSVTRIESYAFYNCKSLTRINSENEGEAILSESLTFMRTDIFQNCNLIKILYLPHNGIVQSGYTNILLSTDYQNFIIYVPQEKYDDYWQKYYDSRYFILPYPRVESTNHTIQYTINSTGNKEVSVINSEALKFVEKMTINGTEVENPKNSTQQLADGENIIKVWLYDSRIINNKLLYTESVNSAEIQNTVTSIGNDAFYYCESLTSVTIPNSVTSIGNDAFYYCRSLTSVTIPNSVTSIGSYAFYDCRSLTSITIPNSVTFINYNAFYYCTSLTSVTIQSTTPPTLGSSVFSSTNSCPIYIPAERVDAYKSATNWSSYADRIQAIPAE